jgi:hypothetical protein
MRRISEACLDAAIKANLGSHRSDEARAKTSVALKGRTFSVETRAKMSAANARRIVSPETRAKMSASRMNFVVEHGVSLGTGAKISAARMGHTVSPETRVKLSVGHRGERNGKNWKGGITPENRLIRSSKAYDAWRTAVYVRDDFTCLACGERGKTLEAHHMD